MTKQPPVLESSPRRHRSLQRDLMLAWLRDTDTHPTAAEIFDAMSGEEAGTSLATVYRNLDVLVGAGELREVVCEGRPSRYDARLEPHQHFSCEGCGRLIDIDLSMPRGLLRRLEDESGLSASRVSITFFGLCEACETGEKSTKKRRAVKA